MIVYDFEVFKYDWLICWLDTETRKLHYIVNDKDKLQKFYEYYKGTIFVGYNSRNYDQWILKAILCDFDPYEMSSWIIEKERKGFEFSRLLNKFPIINYDTSVVFKSLKELEAFMGHNIKETSVPFNIDRKLTWVELLEVLEYCKHDVMETFEVFVENSHEFESHIGLVKEFGLDLITVNKTKSQISAIILGAVKKNRNDEFDISFPDTLELGRYSWLKDWYEDWAINKKNYDFKLEADINGVPHTFGIGGLHGSIDGYYGEGHFLMADVASYYPALMIEYGFLSRNVLHPSKYVQIRDERIKMKAEKDAREYPRKIVLNSTFGALKDQYNALYDPLQSNNVCIAGQLLLVDLLDKLYGKCELIQSNTDGVLLKLYSKDDEAEIISICEEWSKRTRMGLEFERYTKVIQKDVNNYIIIPEGELYDSKGKERFKRKGAYVKKLSRLDNNLPIVNRAVTDYFIKGIKPADTIMASNSLIDFQMITKVSNKYDYAVHQNASMPTVLTGTIHRCFASMDSADGTLYKKHKSKTSLDKTAGTPENCFIINDNIEGLPIPEKLNRQWYIDLAEKRINEFLTK